jgi:hypothetical protein
MRKLQRRLPKPSRLQPLLNNPAEGAAWASCNPAAVGMGWCIAAATAWRAVRSGIPKGSKDRTSKLSALSVARGRGGSARGTGGSAWAQDAMTQDKARPDSIHPIRIRFSFSGRDLRL